MAEKMSLGEFMKRLIAILYQKGVLIPLGREKPWHDLLYDLKTSEVVRGKPEFLTKLWFNWDGHDATSPELSEFLQGLRMSLDTARRLGVFYVVLSKELENLWFGYHELDDKETKEFFKYAIELAEQKFPARAG